MSSSMIASGAPLGSYRTRLSNPINLSDRAFFGSRCLGIDQGQNTRLDLREHGLPRILITGVERFPSREGADLTHLSPHIC